MRGGGADGTAELVTADRDGRNERVVASRKAPATFLNLRTAPIDSLARGMPPAWSPDGKSIAVIGQAATGAMEVVVFDAATQAERSLPVDLGLSGGLTWLDASTMVIDGQPATGPTSRIQQLWRLSYPEGRMSRFTNDLSEYIGVSTTQRRDQIVTTRWELRSGLWVGDASGRNGTELVPSGPDHVAKRFVWFGDRLIYSTAPTGEPSLRSLLPGQKPQAFEESRTPAPTPNDEVRVHTTDDGLFLAKANGGQPQRLAEGRVNLPVVTPDGTHVAFILIREGSRTPWIVPVRGGTPRQVTAAQTASFDVSPDGRHLLLRTLLEGQPALTTCAIEHCVMSRPLATGRFGLPPAKWTPDGRAVAFVDRETVTNVWVQPLDGQPASQLTRFTDGPRIDNFGWSYDGKYLAVSRSTASSDIVLFRRSASLR